jgi:hypothetical protein
MQQSNGDGSDIFWPGYVDAVTNLVLNLLFLLTVMIVAVFMFALELGRASQTASTDTPGATVRPENKAVTGAAVDPVKENIALKQEIQRLNMKLAERSPQKSKPGGSVKTFDVASNAPRPMNGLDKVLANNSEVIVRFADEAVTFTPAEHDQLLASLKPVMSNGKTGIYVEVPAGFSEAKRMGFYRAMAVRNLLVEMKMPKDRIDVSVREVKSNANASIVKVRPR